MYVTDEAVLFSMPIIFVNLAAINENRGYREGYP